MGHKLDAIWEKLAAVIFFFLEGGGEGMLMRSVVGKMFTHPAEL